ncbi:polysaccharide biosynthesis tyrosine autokinase [Desulfospira joergensenii]|uniref:polysaccharide biosynthesis tyrosine autokinase n=1 Tax=Desulfospira joergensenii TaxID=53329 RepID=UPI0003B38184|nr:polysaccharide biosynthesis tyrosine autokinase [Desulfospira joergensenii]
MGKIFKALEKAEKNIHKKSVKSDDGNVASSLTKKNRTKITSDQSVVDGSFQELHSEEKFMNSAPEKVHEGLVTILKPYSPVSEQFRLLKTNIFFPEKGEPPRTIMITSPSPHEGKSFVSANLAISIAQSIDEYVLLMDCDLRAPSIHSLFGFGDREIKGLSEYLSEDLPLPSVLRKTFINKLTILPGGKVPSNPSELLSSEQMRRMLQEVKLRYNDRYILIDTPPPYITSETNAIARYVDGIIVVVRHGKTRIKEVQDIVDIYGKNKILGVINNFSKKSIGYGYGYRKYGYGYHR